jgi:hypothetical protein
MNLDDSFLKHCGDTLTFNGFFEEVDLVFSHFLIQGRVFDSEECCRVLLVTVKSVQHLDKNGTLQRIQKIFQVDIFFHVEIIDKKIKKDLIKYFFVESYLLRKSQRIIFEELKNLFMRETLDGYATV